MRLRDGLEFFRDVPDDDLPEARAFMRRSLRAVTVAMLLGQAFVATLVLVTGGAHVGRLAFLVGSTTVILVGVRRLADTSAGRRFTEPLLLLVGVLAVVVILARSWAVVDGASLLGPQVFAVVLILAGFTPWRAGYSVFLGATTAVLYLGAHRLFDDAPAINAPMVVGIAVNATLFSAGISQMQRRVWADLHRAAERASAASRLSSIGRLAEGLAHETLTPLASSLNELTSAGLLLDELAASVGDPRVGPEDLAQIVTEARASLDGGRADLQRVATLIGGLRAHAHELRDRETHPFSIAECLAVVSSRFARQSHPTVRYVMATAEPYPAHGDAQTLERIVQSLIQNAVHAITESGVGARIEFGVTGTDDDWVVWIDDDGPGIPPELLDRLFRPMVTTRGERSAVGLGLSIARDLTESVFGGRLDLVRASPGARFEIALPRRAPGPLAPLGPAFRPA